jgi:hypothetical protein
MAAKVTGTVLVFLFCAVCAQSADPAQADRVLTHADAAVILAKYSGYFDRYVDPDADLTECVAFMNRTGIYFGLMEVVNGDEFTLKDCARAMGQIDLVLSGSAVFLHGKVKLPKGIATWEEFCIMHGVRYVRGHQTMLEILRLGDGRNP